MKHFSSVLAICALCLFAARAEAAFERNPDRVASIGLGIAFGGLSGDSTVFVAPLSAKQNVTQGLFDFGIDLRLPVSHTVTLFGGITFRGAATDAPETIDLAGQKATLGGQIITLGLRIYLGN